MRLLGFWMWVPFRVRNHLVIYGELDVGRVGILLLWVSSGESLGFVKWAGLISWFSVGIRHYTLFVKFIAQNCTASDQLLHVRL